MAALESLCEYPSLFTGAQYQWICTTVDVATARAVGGLHQLALAEFQKRLWEPSGEE